MATERDNEFSSTGTGSMDQQTDFGSSAGGFGTDRTTGLESEHSQPAIARARGAVSEVGHKAAERVQERLAGQVSRATGQLENVANSLRTASEQMPDDNGIGRYMLQAATQVDNLATFLNNREATELFGEVEDFARRQPAVFIGGAFALGVLGARFLRSSRQNMGLDNQRDWQSGRYEGTGSSFRQSGLGGIPSYPERSTSGYDTGYVPGAAGSRPGYSGDSLNNLRGEDATGGRGFGAGSGDNRDYASDNPSRAGGYDAGSAGSSGIGGTGNSGMTGAGTTGLGSTGRDGTMGAGGTGVRSSEDTSLGTPGAGSTGYTASDPARRSGTGSGGLSQTGLSGDRSTGLSAGNDSSGEGDSQARTDAEIRGMSRSPDYL